VAVTYIEPNKGTAFQVEPYTLAALAVARALLQVYLQIYLNNILSFALKILHSNFVLGEAPCNLG
jgi:hypothetical protein